ncbi:hypothetical protein [Pseudomonas viridiflava]|uniref:hypothetical protein n=1 Tax=Pseudomonas viridiflava TaxID=33069 RepID=UPI000C084509|nr:hypothetical protein [Pseudomonas viridiflava]PHN62934.1 hypothetical protein AO275_05595 [Pseudomonas viridiflava]
MNEFCTLESNNSPTWSPINFLIWKGLPEGLGGGVGYIQRFKDAWLSHNKQYIKSAAVKYSLPVELLAGVCWIETAGDPSIVDRVAFEIRAFDHLGDAPVTITAPPIKTSFGWVSIQLRTAALTLGLNADDMDIGQLRRLANCLETDIYNIDIVAKHLRMLADHDHFTSIGVEEVRVIGARYNRGTNLSLEDIKKDTRYGNFIVHFWFRFNKLMM